MFDVERSTFLCFSECRTYYVQIRGRTKVHLLRAILPAVLRCLNALDEDSHPFVSLEEGKKREAMPGAAAYRRVRSAACPP